MRVVPIEGVAILLGVDRFMSEARAITNLIGNGAATLVILREVRARSTRRVVRVLFERWPRFDRLAPSRWLRANES